MKECVRCGKQFANIKSHLSKKTECPVKYLDIDRNELKKNYGKYYKEYISLKEESQVEEVPENIVVAEHDDRTYFYSPKKLDEIDGEIVEKAQEEDIDLDIISSSEDEREKDECEIDEEQDNNKKKHTGKHKFILKSFGDEEPLDFDDLKELTQYKVSELVPMYVKMKHLDKECNRNIYMKDINNETALFFIDNEWQRKLMKQQFPKIIRACLDDFIKYRDIYSQLSTKDEHYKLLCSIVDKLQKYYDDDISALDDEDLLEIELKIEIEKQKLDKIKKKRAINNGTYKGRDQQINEKELEREKERFHLSKKDQFLQHINDEYQEIKREMTFNGSLR